MQDHQQQVALTALPVSYRYSKRETTIAVRCKLCAFAMMLQTGYRFLFILKARA